MERKIAFLVYQPWKESRRKNDSFDGLSNIGAYMLIDVLNRHSIDCGFCSVDSAYKYDIVLISFTSNMDVFAFAKVVINHPQWKQGRRKFTTIGGGFGLQNPIAIREWLDFAWFGRAENFIIDIVKHGKDFRHESFMDTNNPKVSKIAQSETLYPYLFKFASSAHGKNEYKEQIMGCPNKCFYCHYSWARKFIKTSDHYESSALYSSSQELDMFNVEGYNPKISQLTVGLDGYSERLRNIVNRRTKNEDIRKFLIGITEKTQVKGKVLFMKLYNIIGYESETPADFEEFRTIIMDVEPYLQKRILLTTHSTPLRPSPATPLAYAAIQPTHKLRRNSGTPLIPETSRLLWYNSRFEESDYSRLEVIIVERYTDKQEAVFRFILNNSKFRALPVAQKWMIINNKFDLSDLFREYDVTEQLPSWFLEGYMSQDVMKKLRLQMKSKMQNNDVYRNRLQSKQTDAGSQTKELAVAC